MMDRNGNDPRIIALNKHLAGHGYFNFNEEGAIPLVKISTKDAKPYFIEDFTYLPGSYLDKFGGALDWSGSDALNTMGVVRSLAKGVKLNAIRSWLG